ncbi:MAG: PEP-CTERM sorting domain-containing protein [Pirellulaceae bacterium]
MRIFVALSVVFLCAGTVSADTRIFLNEFNYIPGGGGELEFVEIVVNLNDNAPGFGGLNLSEIRVDLYDGATGNSYANTTLNLLTETADDQARYFVWNTTLEDGTPDGISLQVGNGAAAAQFISYGGTFMGVGGPANGVVSTDVGFIDAAGDDMSVGLIGNGETLEQFSWFAPLAATPGAVNTGQTIPEPASALLLMGGLAGWGLTRRRSSR